MKVLVVAVLVIASSVSNAEQANNKGVGDVGSGGGKQIVKYSKFDFTDCLKAISEKSTAFKGKVFPLTQDGWSFSVVDPDKKETSIYLENGEVYKISPTKSALGKIFQGPQRCDNVTESNTRNKSGASVVNALYQKAMKDNKATSLEDRREIVKRCSGVADMMNAMKLMENGYGGVIGTIPKGGIMGTQPGGVN